MSLLSFKIAAQLDAAGFKQAAEHLRELDKLQGQNVESGQAMTAAWGDLKNQLLGFASVVGVIEFFKSAIDGAAEEQEAMSLLGFKVRSTGKDFEAVREQVEAFTTAIGENTRFSKGEAVKTLGDMVDRTRDLGTAQQLLSTAMGVSIAMHMTLAEAGDLVAGVNENQSRATKTLGREMGLTATQMKDSSFVLEELKRRYGSLGETETSAVSNMKKMQNAFSEFKDEIGTGFLPLLTTLQKALNIILGLVLLLAREIATTLVAAVGGAMSVIGNMLSLLPGETGKFFKDIAQQGDAMMVEAERAAKEDANKFADLFRDKAQKHVAALKAEKAAQQEALTETRLMIAKFNEQGLIVDEEARNAKIASIRAELPLRIQQLKEQLAAEKETAENIAQAVVAARRSADRQIRQIEMEQYKFIFDIANKSGLTIGQAVGKMLAGQKDAWKDAAKSIIDTIAAQTQAAVMANAIQGASKEIAEKGFWLGLPGAMGAIGWGIAQVAAIAGIAEGAKSMIGGGGGGAAAPAAAGGAGGGGAAAGPSAVSAPTAATETQTPTQNIILRVEGSGDQQFLGMLVDRISAHVENTGGRLVATKTVVG